MRYKPWQLLTRLDWPLMLAVFTLLCCGLAGIYSVELSRNAGFGLLQKQAIAVAIGGVIFAFLVNMHYSGWRILARGVYIGSLLMLVAVLFFGRTVNGTTGWFNFGFFAFQPVEFAKFALVIQLARYFGESARRRMEWREIFWSAGLTLAPVLLVMMQPDLGSASILIGLWFIILVFAGLRLPHFSVFAIAAILAMALGWFMLKDYQHERILVFLNPARDPLVRGYNVTQAKIAIGSGEFWGRGLGFGSQNQLRFVPASQTDFIFSVISEELGFIGASLIILCFMVILWRAIVIARRARDGFGIYLALGVGVLLVLQGLMNIGVNLTLLPATGFALPFVSYGGSSIILSFALIGLLQSVAIQQDPSDIQVKSFL